MKTKMWQLTEKRSVCGTGDSPLAAVLESMNVHGNENARVPHRLHWESLLDRYAQRCAWCRETLAVCVCGKVPKLSRKERRAAKRVGLINASEL